MPRRSPHRWTAIVALLATSLAARPASAAQVSLAEAIERASRSALAVVEARGGVGAAESTRVRARLAPIDNPYIEVQLDRGRATRDVAVQSFLALPVEVAGQRGARMAEAERLVDWRRLALAETQGRTLGELLATWGATLVGEARVRRAVAAEEDARSQLQQIEARLAVGDVTLFEKALAEAEVARWGQLRTDWQLQLVRARGLLRQLTASPDLEPQPPADPERPDAPAPRQVLDARALAQVTERAPSLVALRRERDYWGAFARRARVEQVPAVSIIANAGRSDEGDARVGGGLAWTLPVARRNQGEVARASAERARLDELEAATRAAIAARVGAALETLRESAAALQAQDRQAVPAAERLVAAAFETWRRGKTEYVQVLNARRDLALAHSRRLDLAERAWAAYAEIAAITGELP